MSETAENIYSSFSINRKQAQTLAFMALSYDIEKYIEDHREEYEQFLQEEKEICDKEIHSTDKSQGLEGL